MKHLSTPIICLLLAAFSTLGAQELFYYGANSKPLENEKDAVFRKELIQKGETRYTLTTRYLAGDEWVFHSRERIRIKGDVLLIKSKGERFISVRVDRRMRTLDKGYYAFTETESGTEGLIREGFSSRLLPLHLEDTVKTYYKNGQLKALSLYRNNQIQWNRNWLRDGSPYIDSVYYSADREPEFQYGDAFFNNYILQSLQKSGYDLSQINDVVEIGWVIMEDGSMKGLRSLQGKIPKLNRYLMEAIASMPGYWKAAELDGKPVRYFMSVPLNFQSRETSFQSMDFSSGMIHYDRH